MLLLLLRSSLSCIVMDGGCHEPLCCQRQALTDVCAACSLQIAHFNSVAHAVPVSSELQIHQPALVYSAHERNPGLGC